MKINDNMFSVLYFTELFSKDVSIDYQDEYFSFKERAVNTLLIDSTLYEEKKIKIYGDLEGKKILYRGYILSLIQYKELEEYISERGGELLVDYSMYSFSSSILNWYKDLSKYTFKTDFYDSEFNNIENGKNIYSIKFDKVFVKDEFKSLGTTRGSVAKTPDEFKAIANELKRYYPREREIYCAREYKDLLTSTEKRYFYFNGKVLNNNNSLLDNIVSSLKEKTIFCSIDICLDIENNYYLVEIGDGQCSDLKNNNVQEFVDFIVKNIN